MRGFYWLLPAQLAGASRPGGYPGLPGEQQQLAEDLAFLQAREIGAILTLTEDPVDPDSLKSHGFAHHHIPIVDMTAPAPEQITEALGFIDDQIARGQRVVVHCLAGQGRTGTILAAYLIRAGASPERSIAELRLVCPHAVENARQEEALAEFARRRDWLI